MPTSISRTALLEDLNPADMAADRVLCLGHAIKEIMGPRLAKTALELGVRLGGGTLAHSACISDGGDGFLEVCQQVFGLTGSDMVVRNPLGRLVVVPVAMDLARGIGALEVAKIGGLAMIPPSQRDVIHSSTMGLGDAIYRLIASGVREIHIGLGGSATCDGGAGMLIKLQETLLAKASGVSLYTVENLDQGNYPDVAALRARLQDLDVRFTVYSDVQCPLLGPDGAARLFAPQKGASPEDVDLLEEIIGRWATEAEGQIGEQIRDLPGAGAAGGLGFAFAALGFRPTDGATRLFHRIGLSEKLADCDSVLTCEGKFDRSSLTGKAPWKAAMAARKSGRRATILCGVREEEAALEAQSHGIRVVEFGRDIHESRRSAESFTKLSDAVRQILRGLV